MSSVTGFAFHFLPTPIQTRLPVHVNAPFELTSDRSNLHLSADTNPAKTRWNKGFLPAISGAYIDVISALAPTAKSYGHSYKIWPTNDTVADYWAQLVEGTFHRPFRYEFALTQLFLSSLRILISAIILGSVFV